MNYNLQGFKELQYVDWQLDLQRTTTWWTTNATYWIWYGLNDLHRICSEDIKTGSLNIKIKFCGIHGEKSTWIHQFYCCLYPQFYNWNLEEISLSIKSFISMVLLFIALIYFFLQTLSIFDWSKIEGVCVIWWHIVFHWDLFTWMRHSSMQKILTIFWRTTEVQIQLRILQLPWKSVDQSIKKNGHFRL